MLKNKSGKIIVWIVIIVVILAGIATMLFYKNNSNKVSTENTNNNEAVLESQNGEEIFVKGSAKGVDEWNISFSNEEYNTYNGEKLVSKNVRNVPTIENASNTEAATKIQESLIKLSDENWEEVKKASDEYKNVESSETLGVIYLTTMENRTDNYITFKFTQSGGFGGVSWNDIKYYMYNLKSGEMVELKDITSDYEQLVEKLYDIAENYLEIEKLGTAENWKDKLKDIITESGNYGLLTDKLQIVLPKYSVSAGASGVIQIDADYDKLGNLIKEECK